MNPIYSHKDITSRLSNLQIFIENFNIKNIEVYCDNMTSVNFEKVFSAWPFRYYIVSDMIIEKIGQPKNAEFDVCEIGDL